MFENLKTNAESNKILQIIKKIKCINYLGSICKECGESNIHKLVFHHIDRKTKEFNICKRNKYLRWSEIKTELDKCLLLCHNCHRELHYNENNENPDNRRITKQFFLEYSNVKCIECGYNKCNAALDFHHRNMDDKKFNISKIIATLRISNLVELDKNITDELNKCDVLCSNCHMLKHVDLTFYDNNIEYINMRLLKNREIQKKLDVDIILKMYIKGIRQIDIAKHFKASKGTISDIIKVSKVEKQNNCKVDIAILSELHKNGYRIKKLAEFFNVSVTTIKRYLKKLKSDTKI